METLRIEVGDWVRFSRGGALVIDEVYYIKRRHSWDPALILVTAQHGDVAPGSVLEARRVSKQPDSQEKP